MTNPAGAATVSNWGRQIASRFYTDYTDNNRRPGTLFGKLTALDGRVSNCPSTGSG